MEALVFWVYLLLGLCVRPSFAFPSKHYTQDAFFQRPQIAGSAKHTEQQKAPVEEREQVNTISVTCHPDSLEIVIQADMFAVGAPVNGDELRLGVEHNDYCRATASSGHEYRILVGLVDCGTKHWMTEDALVYTNLLIYSPVDSSDGVVRMDEAVIPIECHYERKYSLSSSSVTPTWIPFTSTQSAVETLDFNLRIMTNDWLYERSSNVFYLGEPIAIEASVRVGHHMGLRVFISSCVATLNPDIYSVPRYVFIENGCLIDSQLPGSRSQFFSRTEDNKLQLAIDAFRFHNEDRGELYITCHLQAVPVHDSEAPNKACTFVNGRWRSADGNDYLCGHCQHQMEVGQTKPSSPAKFGPRGIGKPDGSDPSWRSAVWDQEESVGPVIVLPGGKKSGPIPEEDLPLVLKQISRPRLYSSEWRSGINDRRVDQNKGLLPDSPSTPDQEEVQITDDDNETDLEDGDDDEVALPDEASFEMILNPEAAALDNNDTAAFSDVSPTAQFTVAVTELANATVSEPKR